MKNHIRRVLPALVLVSILGSHLPSGFAQGTAFIYQGRLNNASGPVNGIYDLQFTIYDSSGGATVIAGPLTHSPTGVTNGLFTVTLDFGAGVFTGAERWLEIGVRTSGTGQFTTLSPRQKISAAPHAITASHLTGTLPAGQLSGNLAAGALPTGGNWPLSSTLTLDSGTLSIDPGSDRVGIGTTTPTAPLTIRPTSSFYGLEHTDGTRRLSTYLDENGCWFGSVSPHKLFFYVNNGVPSMTVDLAGRVGLGTMSPVDSLHVVAGLGSVRLDSTSNPNGSVLELRNTMVSPSYLGAINFNNAGGTYPGQIGYLANHDLVFRTAGTEWMRLDNAGRLDVNAANSSVSLNAVDVILSVPFSRAVKATSDSLFGTAVLASSIAGTAIAGASANGMAGSFFGAVRIEGDSSHTKPFLQLHETEDGDYARIQLQVANRPLWHVSVGGADNSLVFYNSANSVVTAVSETGVLTTKVLTITGGADIAEPFEMSEDHLPKGAVVVIDEDHPGKLKLGTKAYDRCVAGIISGAGGVSPGLRLSQQGVLEGDQHVALSGRVYAQADATYSPIKPGDLLTTSDTPGHARKADDPARAQGAVLGKAMSGLEEGRGLVLVLVTLQ